MVDEELEKACVRGISPIIMKLSLKNGQEYTVNIKHPRGHPQNPLTMEEVREKFEKCSEYVGLPREKISKLASAIENLEDINNVADLEELLTGAKV